MATNSFPDLTALAACGGEKLLKFGITFKHSVAVKECISNLTRQVQRFILKELTSALMEEVVFWGEIILKYEIENLPTGISSQIL